MSNPAANCYRFENHEPEAITSPSSPRQRPWASPPNSISSRQNSFSRQTTPASSRSSSVHYHGASSPPRSQSVAFPRGVTFQQGLEQGIIPPATDELIFIPVRLTTPHRQSSISGSEELPARPPRRPFFRRLTTRLFDSREEAQYRCLKLPRSEYKRHFARDSKGNYAGTEPQREWDEADLIREFGQYQDTEFCSICC